MMIIRWFKKHKRKAVFPLLLTICILTFFCAVSNTATVHATTADEPAGRTSIDATDTDTFSLNISSNAGSTNLSATLQILIVLTVLALAPSILIMVTSFTRIIVVLHFVRTALATQTTPPNQVLVGLALFLTLFIMSPVITQVNEQAVQPFMSGEMKQEEALEKGIEPIRQFMLGQTRDKDLKLFLNIAEIPSDNLESYDDVPTTVLIPAFIISELRMAFIIGFVIYMPFIIIDMVVASTLMSMGMMMLPPTTISMPFKILLFVLADGWNLVVGELVKTFY